MPFSPPGRPLGMGRRESKIQNSRNYRLEFQNYRLPILNYRLPVLHHRLPITDTDFNFSELTVRITVTDPDFIFSRGGKPWKTNREKIINNEIFFSPFMSLINREKLCVNRENRHQKSTIFSPLVFHRLRLHDFFRIRLEIILLQMVMADRTAIGDTTAAIGPM